MVRMIFQQCWSCDLQTWSNYTLCNNCKAELEDQILTDQMSNCILKKQQIETFDFLYLFDMNKSKVGHSWVYSLKKGRCHLSNYEYASQLLLNDFLRFNNYKINYSVIVTPPSIHSERLASQFSSHVGIPFIQGLEKIESQISKDYSENIIFNFINKILFGKLNLFINLFTNSNTSNNSLPQKKKSKFERMNLEYRWNKQNLHNSFVIFIDDVVTTGSSAVAAWLAIGKPKNFLVLSLGYTSKK